MVKKLDYNEYSKRILSDEQTNNNDNFIFDITNISNFIHKMSYMSPIDLMSEYSPFNKKKMQLSKCFDVSVEKFIT
jgi:hypothetical protein